MYVDFYAMRDMRPHSDSETAFELATRIPTRSVLAKTRTTPVVRLPSSSKTGKNKEEDMKLQAPEQGEAPPTIDSSGPSHQAAEALSVALE